MQAEEIGQSIKFHLKNVALSRFRQLAEYPNIISPFSRMYLITEGEGYLVYAGKKTKLEAGYIYLIPSYTLCTYVFNAGLAHYYIHFSMETTNGLSVYNLFSVLNKTIAIEHDKTLFTRLLDINPDLQLPHHDPKVYQTKPWIHKKVTFQSLGQLLETIGIIKQLFSRFINPEPLLINSKLSGHNIHNILVHIQNKLADDISVEELANMACMSKDHFTRIFKSITGMPPCEFIIRKRIEIAQLFLLTTDLPINQIIDQAGFKTAAYFCRIFKKYTSFTPEEYRRKRE